VWQRSGGGYVSRRLPVAGRRAQLDGRAAGASHRARRHSLMWGDRRREAGKGGGRRNIYHSSVCIWLCSAPAHRRHHAPWRAGLCRRYRGWRRGQCACRDARLQRRRAPRGRRAAVEVLRGATQSAHAFPCSQIARSAIRRQSAGVHK